MAAELVVFMEPPEHQCGICRKLIRQACTCSYDIAAARLAVQKEKKKLRNMNRKILVLPGGYVDAKWQLIKQGVQDIASYRGELVNKFVCYLLIKLFVLIKLFGAGRNWTHFGETWGCVQKELEKRMNILRDENEDDEGQAFCMLPKQKGIRWLNLYFYL